MKKILVFVTSLDGKITHWDEGKVKGWSSKEDQEYFKKIWDESEITVLGSGTYNAAPMHPTATQHLLVMTRTPKKYKDDEIANRLEFTDQSPAEIVAHYEKKGLDEMLIAGGAHVATTFLKAELIDEIWLTVEPKIFGSGSNFVSEEELAVDLQLISFEKVNERGTLITKYAVMKKH